MPPTSSSSAAAAATASSQPPSQSSSKPVTNPAPGPAPIPNPESQKPESGIRFGRKFACSLCTLSFEGSAEQREHMRGEWHVYNLKLKMQSLPAVSESTFVEERKAESSKGKRKVDDVGTGRLDKGAMLKFSYHTQAEVEVGTNSEEDDEEDEEGDELDTSSEEDDEDETDDEEDEYSVSASSSDAEESGNSEAINLRDRKETLFLPSGKIVGRKGGERERRTEKRTKAKGKGRSESINTGGFEDVNITTSSTSSSANNPENTATERANGAGNELIKTVKKKKKKESRALAERHAAGLVGLSDKQRSVLAREEKKMMSLEGRERGGFAESVDRKGNSQKHYRIGGSRGGKKMGGLEKRLG